MRSSPGRIVAAATSLLLVVGGVAAGAAAAAPGIGPDRALEAVALVVPWAGAALSIVALAWAAVRGPAAVLRLAPLLTVAHAATVAASGESLVLAATSPAAGALVALVSWPWQVLGAARRDRARVLAGVDALVVAAADLRAADVAEVGARLCRLGADLAAGDGAVLYVEGPGRIAVAGRHGAAAPVDLELGGDPGVAAVLRGAALREGDPLLVPVLGQAGVVGVVAVHGARRDVDEVLAGLLALFGTEAGGALDRMARSGLGYSVAETDPVTGVGNRRQASALVAALRPGDGLVVLEVDGLDPLGASHGGAGVDLLLGQMGLHLRNGTRPGDAVARLGDHQFVIALRELKAPVDVVVRRLIGSWLRAHPARPVSVGAALHLVGNAPIDTLERAQEALASARRSGGGQAHVAPDLPARVAV
jgi:GGDEF domain-containing protein